jgi:hypothetical protein
MRIATGQKYHPPIKIPNCLIIFEQQIETMRKTLTSLMILAAATQVQAQLLPNGSFEDWTGSGTSVQMSGGWRGNGVLRLENLTVNSQSGQETRLPAGGRYFIGLRNVVSGTQGSLGFIANRFAFNARPVSMRTAVMYFPGTVAGESWGFRILFLKNNMSGGKDTILQAGGVLNPQAIGDWGQFTVGLSQLYNSNFTDNPDTADITFTLTPNSTSQISAAGLLALDMMTFTDFAVSAKPFSVDAVGQVNVFPNPAANTPVQFSFRNGMKGQGRLDVYNLQGQLVKTLFDGTLEQGAHQYTLPAGSLSQGMYIYRLTHEGGVKEGKFAIQ